jgi:hypothetical protein
MSIAPAGDGVTDVKFAAFGEILKAFGGS